MIIEASFPPEIGERILLRRPIQDWMGSVGVSDPAAIRPLGEGGQGWAFIVGDKVAKVTPNRQEAEISSLAMQKCSNELNVITIYGVTSTPEVIFHSAKQYDMYVIIMDYISTDIPAELAAAADIVGAYLDNRGWPPIPGGDIEPIFQECIAGEYYDNDPDPTTRTNAFVRDILVIVRSIQDCGLLLKDVGATNIGLSDGRIVLFDFGAGTEFST